MTPVFRIVADGRDITRMINDRLLLLRTSDKPGMESDEFELRIDDRDSAVTLPSRGASIEIYLGYAGSTLSREGRYVVDEVEVSGPPDTLVIRGKASDMRGRGKTTRSGSWEGDSLVTIVRAVTASGKRLGVVTINKTDVSRYSFRLGDRSTHKAVSTKYQDKATGKLAVVNLNNDDAPDGLPPVHVAGVPYLLALSKSSLNGVPGV